MVANRFYRTGLMIKYDGVIMLKQEPMMAAHTDMAIMSFLMPGNGQKADIGLLKE